MEADKNFQCRLLSLYADADLAKDQKTPEDLLKNLNATSQKILKIIKKEEFLPVLLETGTSSSVKKNFYEKAKFRIKKWVFGLNTRLFGFIYKKDAKNIARNVLLIKSKEEAVDSFIQIYKNREKNIDQELIDAWNNIPLKEIDIERLTSVANRHWDTKGNEWKEEMIKKGWKDENLARVLDEQKRSDQLWGIPIWRAEGFTRLTEALTKRERKHPPKYDQVVKELGARIEQQEKKKGRKPSTE